MFIKVPARRPRSNVPDSDSVPGINVEVTEYGPPFDPAPAVALVIAVGLAMIPIGPFPPPSPPPPGAAALMVVDLPELDPLLEVVDDIAGIVIPEPIAEEQENGHYHHHQQYQHLQNFPPPTFPQQPHPASFPSSSSAEGVRVAVDSSIANSAVLVAPAWHRRSSRRTKPPPSSTSCGLPKCTCLLAASTTSTSAQGITTVTQHSLSNLRRTRSVNSACSPPSLPPQRRRSLRLLGRQTMADTHLVS